MPKWQTRYLTKRHEKNVDKFTDINGQQPSKGAQMSERTGSRPIQFSNVAARGDKTQVGDVQTGGVMKPRRKAVRIPTDKISSSAFKVRRQPVAAKPDRVKVVVK